MKITKLRNAFIFSSVFFTSSTLLAQEWSMPPAVVEIAQVENTKLALTIDIPANIVSKDYAWFSAETTGKVKSLNEIGTKVKSGDVIAVLQTTTLRAQRDEQKNAVDAAGARIQYLRNQVKRLQELRTQNIVSDSQIEDTQSELNLAISSKASAQARLAQVEIGIAASSIRAQFNGTVTEHGIRIGEWASPGQKIIRVVSLEAKELVARAPLKTLRFAESGDVFTINNAAKQGSAIIKAIVPYGEITDGVYELRMDLQKGDWLVGESITIQVPQSEAQAVITVPRDAILLRSGGSSVIKLKDDKSFTRIAVSTGLGNKQRIEVRAIDGELNIGDKVIIRGGERLQDGQDFVIKK